MRRFSRAGGRAARDAQRASASGRARIDVDVPEFIPTVLSGSSPRRAAAPALGCAADDGRRRRGPPADRRSRRAGPARRRQRGRRGARRDGDVVRAEPLLTGLGAGGYMLVPSRARRRRCWTSSSRRPATAPTRRRARRSCRPRCPSRTPPRCSTSARRRAASTGRRRGSARRTGATRPSRSPSSSPRRPRSRARASSSTPSRPTSSRCSSRSRALDAGGARAVLDRRRVAREGDVLADPELADTLERLGAEGAAPFYTGDIARGGVRAASPRAAAC